MDTLKKSLIQSFYTMPLLDELKDSKVVFVTHTGIITGTPVSKDEPSKTIRDLATISMECIENYCKDHSLDDSQPLDENDGFMILKDVEFKSGNNTFRFNYLNIFFDQIIGVTLADSI
ncbi:MAG: hypothetical protein K2N43_07740 [Lachnospiraceae bacterium]|nr:hypothetical protein [Lachnospiraceae bacterium]